MTVQPFLPMCPEIFDADLFKDDFDKIVELMPTDSEFQTQSREHMIGIATQIQSVKTKDQTSVDTLKMYLDEMDRRRNTNWKELFPWLVDQ